MVPSRSFPRALATIVFGAAFCALVLSANLAAQVPSLNQPLAPTSVAPGSGAFTLTLYGANFTPASIVKWNGAALSTTYVSLRELSAAVPASYVAVAGTAAVTVSNPAPSGASNTIPFAIMAPTASLAFAPSTIATGLNPTGIVVADFNNDGKPDLAIIDQYQPDPSCYHNYGLGTFSILLGNGDGTFATKTTMCLFDGLGVYPGSQLVAGDFNNNGRTDLLYAINSSCCGAWSPAIFLGNGDGTFASGSSLAGWEGDAQPMVAGDFNGDGNLDVAYAQVIDPGPFLFVQFGAGDGSFSCCTDFAEESGFAPVALTSDFNNDGVLDFAMSDGAIFLGNGDGTFTHVTAQVPIGGSVTADFNGDGNLDLIGNGVIFFGNGDGTFNQGPALPSACQSAVAAGEFNGDGKLDLVCTAGNTFSILLGNGDGTFRTGFIGAVGAPYGVAVGDFNGDGRLDLAVTNPSDNTVSIFLQTASSAGAAASMVSAENPAGMNQPVTFTTVVYGNPMPTGSVTFKQGQNVLGAAPLVNGQASVTATFAKAGTFAITARYSGDQNYAAQKSNVVKQVVSEYSSSIEVESGSSFSYYGQVVPVTAYVDSAAPSPPTGTVTFYDGTQSLGKVAVANGSATILLRSSLPAGTYSITATYNGDAMSGKSATATALTQTIYPATTATALTSSGNPSVVGHNVTFTATVTSPTSLPKGTVTFTAGGVTLGTVNVNGDKASLTTCRLPAGTITVTATYNGTANIGGSSQSMVQTVH